MLSVDCVSSIFLCDSVSAGDSVLMVVFAVVMDAGLLTWLKGVVGERERVRVCIRPVGVCVGDCVGVM